MNKLLDASPALNCERWWYFVCRPYKSDACPNQDSDDTEGLRCRAWMNSSQMKFSCIILSLFHNCLNHSCTTFKGLIIFVFQITYLYSLDGLFFFSSRYWGLGFLQPSKTCGKNVLIAKLVTTKGFNWDAMKRTLLTVVGALCWWAKARSAGLRPFLLWVGELGLTHYTNRTLLKDQSLHKPSTQK